MKTCGERPTSNNNNLRQNETIDMVLARVKEWRWGYHQEDVKHARSGKGEDGEAQQEMTGSGMT